MVVSVLSVPVNVMTLSVTTDNLGVGTVAAADPALCCAVLCCAVLCWPLCLTVLIKEWVGKARG